MLRMAAACVVFPTGDLQNIADGDGRVVDAFAMAMP